MTNFVHQGDLPPDITFNRAVAVDSETMGLYNQRDRLCVVQLSGGDGDAHLVQFSKDSYDAPHLKKVLSDPSLTKIFHYARFDVAVIKHYLNIDMTPIYCTKIASKLARTYTDSHGLKDLCLELLNKKISKQQQSSDWGSGTLSKAQIEYAAADVLHLHKIRDALNAILTREGRMELAQQCFDFLPARVALDQAGWLDIDIFAHHSGK